jgi:hypothetical protein
MVQTTMQATAKEELLAVCPYRACNKVIFRKAIAVFSTTTPNVFEFTSKCPHCGNLVKINIGIGIKASPVER